MEIKSLDGKTVFIKGKKEGILICFDKKLKDSGKNNYRAILCTNNFCSSTMSGEKVTIAGTGEYEVGGVEFLGVNSGNNTTAYVINIDGIAVGILGDMVEPLTDKRVERINEVDVLIVSLSMGEKIKVKTILDWAKKWGANYLIPVNFEGETGDKLKKFLDEADSEGLAGVESLKVDKDDLPEGREVVILKNTG